jgi:hypothetical protein
LWPYALFLGIEMIKFLLKPRRIGSASGHAARSSQSVMVTKAKRTDDIGAARQKQAKHDAEHADSMKNLSRTLTPAI